MKFNLKKQIHFSAIFWLAATTAFAATQPKFSIVPSTQGGNVVQLIQGDIVTTSYQVTNNLPTTKTLTMKPIPGVTQKTRGAGVCGNKFTLAHGQSCTLNLLIDSRQMVLGTKTFQAPEVCIGTTQLSCTKPWASNYLVIDVLVVPPIFSSLSVSTLDVVTATDVILPSPTGWKTITITNAGPLDAVGMTYTFSPALPTGTIVDNQCPVILVGNTCVLTLKPGATPSTPPSTLPIPAPGLPAVLPIPSVMTIKGTDTHTLMVDLTVLTYGNVYQGGYVFDIDALTADRNVGGKVVTPQNYLFPWITVATKDLGDSVSITDGSHNTTLMVQAFGTGQYSAYYCYSLQADEAGTPCLSGQTCYTSWYLPAICEITNSPANVDCTILGSNSIENRLGLIPAQILWSSSQGPNNLGIKYFANSRVNEEGLTTDQLGVMCVRSLT